MATKKAAAVSDPVVAAELPEPTLAQVRAVAEEIGGAPLVFFNHAVTLAQKWAAEQAPTD